MKTTLEKVLLSSSFKFDTLPAKISHVRLNKPGRPKLVTGEDYSENQLSKFELTRDRLNSWSQILKYHNRRTAK